MPINHDCIIDFFIQHSCYNDLYDIHCVSTKSNEIKWTLKRILIVIVILLEKWN